MVMAEGEMIQGLRRGFPKASSDAKPNVDKPTLYSEKEIGDMIKTPPSKIVGRVETPVETWHMEGNIAVSDMKPIAEIDRITKIPLRRKLAVVITKILNMS